MTNLNENLIADAMYDAWNFESAVTLNVKGNTLKIGVSDITDEGKIVYSIFLNNLIIGAWVTDNDYNEELGAILKKEDTYEGAEIICDMVKYKLSQM